MADQLAQSEADEEGTESLAECAITMHVEVATTSMSLREWHEMKPGVVFATGTPVGKTVTLRAGARPVGVGELCVVDGVLAIRLLSKYTQSAPEEPVSQASRLIKP